MKVSIDNLKHAAWSKAVIKFDNNETNPSLYLLVIKSTVSLHSALSN